MTADTHAALLMMAAALPTMFLVIGVFVFFTGLLVKAFPETEK